MKTILVVDDNFGFLFWLGETLENSGYRVVPAGNVEEAQTLLGSIELIPDLVIINPALPKAAGFVEVLRRVRPVLRVVAAVEEGGNGLDGPIAVAADRVARKPRISIDAALAIRDETHDTDIKAKMKRKEEEWLRIVRAALDGRATTAG